MTVDPTRKPGEYAASHRTGVYRDSSGRHVYEVLRMRIRSGAVNPDELLVDTTLVRSLNATRHAVRHALQSLAEEGLLQRSPRFGTRLSARIANVPLFGELHPQHGDEADPNLPSGQLVVRPIQRAIVASTEVVAAKLGLPTGTRVAALEQELYVDGEAVGVRSIYFTPDPDAEHVVACADSGDHDPVTFEEFFVRVYGAAPARSKVTVEAVPSISPDHDILGLTAGSPILLRTMHNFDRAGRPLAISFTHTRGDRIAMTSWSDHSLPGMTERHEPRSA